MELLSFGVSNLYGIYSYHFEINKEQNIFILTGPNGYGKTTILNILNSLSQKELIYFYVLPFERIEIRFSMHIRISIVSEKENSLTDSETYEEDRKVLQDKRVIFYWYSGEELVSKLVIDKRSLLKATRNIGFYSRQYYSGLNFQSNEFLRFVRANSRIYDLIAKEQNQELFLMLLDSLGFSSITAQRINQFRRDNERKDGSGMLKSSISDVVNRLEIKLKNIHFEYLNMSQSRNAQLIETLLHKHNQYQREEYDNKKREIEKIVKELVNFGLMPITKLHDYEDENARILSAEIDELKEKVTYYEKILEQLRCFVELLNNKKFANKTIEIAPSYGLRFRTLNGENLDVEKLSSGEQNEVIMLYNLIFEGHDNSVLLIDEPEISLHVVWQHHFMKDLEKVAKLRNLQILVATHSPQIIAERWEDTYDLLENSI